MSPYATMDQINYIQVDHTSRCNLLCLQCARVHQGNLNPSLPMDELQLSDYQNIFSQSLPQLQEMFFCGNYGDASVSQSFLPALEYLRQSRPLLTLKLSTNGSARQPDWWRELAVHLRGPRDLVAFSIDGLENTNSIYRVNSQWNKIVENASAFIQAGGRARWDFLVFSHNEHQVEEARALAKKLGFVSFTVKRSNRFLKFAQSPVQAPSNREYLGQAMSALPALMQEQGSWAHYQDTTAITCKFKTEKRGVFLDFQGKLWPCCWMAAPLHQHDETEQKPYIQQLLAKYGEDFHSLRKNSWEKVLTHPWFAQELVQSWGLGGARSPTCARNCGEKIRFSSENAENRNIENLNQQKQVSS